MAEAVQRPIARNDPCTCGSGRRYKDCHGSLRPAKAVAIAPISTTKGRYRPAGDDWSTIAEEDRDRLGALMERALAEQKAGHARDAERLYRTVLEQAPQTHDALHMLGVVRLGLGDFSDAERLIRQAMAQRPAYPAIAANWSLVRRSIAARDRSGIEIVSEHALPLLMHSLHGGAIARAGAPAGAPDLHVVGSDVDVAGDASWLMRRLPTLLAPLRARFWNLPPSAPAHDEWRRLDARRIDVATGRYPGSGAAVLVGCDGQADGWLHDSIDRLLVFVQPQSPSLSLEGLRRVAADGRRPLTLVFDSRAKARRFGAPEHVLVPPIDIDARAAPREPPRAFDARTLRVGTVGQDGRRIVPAADGAMLGMLAERAGRLDVLDPGPLRYALGPSRAVVCVSRGQESVSRFVSQCDVYLHRTLPWWSEDPRALFAAMLHGVAVLCPRSSVYAEYVTDGVDGWLYDDADDALRVVGTLRDQRERLASAGARARERAAARFEPRALVAAYSDLVGKWLQGG